MRIEDGGFGNIAGDSFQIKQSAVAPSSVSGLTASTIEQMFSMLPEAGLVSESGSAHTQASQLLHEIAEDLVTHAQVLQENWSGTAATAALSNLQMLHTTAMSLAVASAKTGAVLTWMGGLLPYYKSYQAPPLSLVGHIEAALGDNPQDKAAQAVLTRFNNRLVQANDNLPSEVTKDLPANYKDEELHLGSGPGGGVAAGAAAAGAAVGGAAGSVGARTGGTGGATGVGERVPAAARPAFRADRPEHRVRPRPTACKALQAPVPRAASPPARLVPAPAVRPPATLGPAAEAASPGCPAAPRPLATAFRRAMGRPATRALAWPATRPRPTAFPLVTCPAAWVLASAMA